MYSKLVSSQQSDAPCTAKWPLQHEVLGN